LKKRSSVPLGKIKGAVGTKKKSVDITSTRTTEQGIERSAPKEKGKGRGNVAKSEGKKGAVEKKREKKLEKTSLMVRYSPLRRNVREKDRRSPPEMTKRKRKKPKNNSFSEKNMNLAEEGRETRKKGTGLAGKKKKP